MLSSSPSSIFHDIWWFIWHYNSVMVYLGGWEFIIHVFTYSCSRDSEKQEKSTVMLWFVTQTTKQTEPAKGSMCILQAWAKGEEREKRSTDSSRQRQISSWVIHLQNMFLCLGSKKGMCPELHMEVINVHWNIICNFPFEFLSGIEYKYIFGMCALLQTLTCWHSCSLEDESLSLLWTLSFPRVPPVCPDFHLLSTISQPSTLGLPSCHSAPTLKKRKKMDEWINHDTTCWNGTKTYTDVHDPQMMNPGDFNKPLNFNLVWPRRLVWNFSTAIKRIVIDRVRVTQDEPEWLRCSPTFSQRTILRSNVLLVCLQN